MTGDEVLARLWAETPFDPDAVRAVHLERPDLKAPSSFEVAALAQATIAASALAAAEFHHSRGGARQEVSVDAGQALAEFWSENYLMLNGERAGEIRDPITGLFRTSDGWVRLHANFPHHRDGLLQLLQCEHEAKAVTAALAGWKAKEFEAEVARRGLCASALRSFAEWDEHPQAAHIAAMPLISVEKVGEAPANCPPAGVRPLSGIRVLDLTRIISGPVCGRTLAAHGADVLRVTARHLPAIPALDMDTGRGKKGCAIDLRTEEGRGTLARLVAEADVFVQGYRPGSLGARGFGWQEVVAMRPGVIHASLSAYGEDGPWGGRRGFDSLVQTAAGFNHTEGEVLSPGEPRPLPVQALDHATGYLLATGVMAALDLRARVGGSWRVGTCLARTALWLRSLGRVAEPGPPLPSGEAVGTWREEADTAFGRLSFIGHAARMSVTPPAWGLPSAPLDSSPPAWW
jgi:crotonobetainyl-CoA:carnitine CoA-transferase CaiB-like acyl-CoA transferase